MHDATKCFACNLHICFEDWGVIVVTSTTRVKEDVHIAGIIRRLVTLERYLKNKFYTLVIFGEIYGLV